MTNQEIEAKFHVKSLKKMERRLQEMKAHLIQPRVLEVNRRFDLPDESLRAAGRVLRLRKDTEVHLTYKGKSKSNQGVLNRTELEVTLSDMETAQKLLEALGYVQSAVYEKYRSVYEAGDCHVMLDELPYGEFLEIEGPDEAAVQAMAQELGLALAKAVQVSYLRLFERYCAGRPLNRQELTFEALQGWTVLEEELGVENAEEVTSDG
jgi:adenylate cyclase class 2